MARDPYRYFRVEARELLEQLGQGALDLEKGVPPGDLIARLLRLAHTLKGAARVVRQSEIASDAHTLEDLFTGLRERTAVVPRQEIDLMLTLLDDMGRRVAALRPPRLPAEAPPSGVETDEPVHVFRPDVQDVESLAAGLSEVQAQLSALRPALDHSDRIRHLIDLIGEQFARLGRDGMMPGDRPWLERTRSMMEELRQRFGALESDVVDGIDQIESELRQVSDAAARLRLVAASMMFRFLERAARDAAQAVGRRVTFEGRGGEVRLDPGMLTIIQGALLHVVRNAVAHGVEPAEERRAAGKSPEGAVTVAVTRHGTSVSFACSDDGRGIDFVAIRRTLHRAGLSSEELEKLDADTLIQRLLAGGISTSGTVTDVAGRGVGLDVVRECAERLGGTVRMRTEPGTGTTIEIIVPVSVASFHALLVEAGGVAAAVPLESVRGTLRVANDQIVDTTEGGSIVHQGQSIPFSPLRRVVRPTQSEPDSEPVTSAFVVDVEGGSAAFAVDRIVGIGNVVARPLPALAPALTGVLGASLDTRGQPRLVLDPDSLVAEARRAGWTRQAVRPSRPSILVVDDSLTTRMLEQSILESAGYEVDLASSGEEGLEKARAGDYGLFLVDVEMPGVDGFTFIERIRADSRLGQTPAILVTSRASAEDRRRGREVGAQGYIVKDEFDQGALLERIRTLMQ